MDKVRFGRALGYGARHATKALVQAVDAATTPSPTTPRPSAPAQTTPTTAALQQTTALKGTGFSPSVPSGRSSGALAPEGQAARHLTRSVATPLKKFTSVLWLQVTGTFFAVLAAFLSQGLWTHRTDLHLGLASHQAQRLLLHAVAFLFFAYFALSNFVRAYRRDRK